MILPIVAYGSPILRNVGKDIDKDYPGLDQLIADMWDTMYKANGVGLAAPQINRDIRLFVMDSQQLFANPDEYEGVENYPDAPGYKGAFINARILNHAGKDAVQDEGCLSIPKLRGEVTRKSEIEISFMDESFTPRVMKFNGFTARVIQHEYDHIEGKLFIDYLPPLKKTLMKRKLEDISKGKIDVSYRMIFPK